MTFEIRGPPYSLLATCYFLLTTCYLLLATCYLLTTYRDAWPSLAVLAVVRRDAVCMVAVPVAVEKGKGARVQPRLGPGVGVRGTALAPVRMLVRLCTEHATPAAAQGEAGCTWLGLGLGSGLGLGLGSGSGSGLGLGEKQAVPATAPAARVKLAVLLAAVVASLDIESIGLG